MFKCVWFQEHIFLTVTLMVSIKDYSVMVALDSVGVWTEMDMSYHRLGSEAMLIVVS